MNFGSLKHAWLLVVVCMALPAAANAQVARYFGDYRVEAVTRYGGGLTSEAEANSFVGRRAHIGNEAYSVLDVLVKDPLYRMRTIPIGKEGNVIPRDTSIFYGYRADRAEVKRLEIFKHADGHESQDPYDTLEVLSDDTLLEMYDGWFILLKKES